MAKLEIKGKKFGRLYVEDYAYTKKYATFWKCKCDCGNTKIIKGCLLTTGNTSSCGCIRKENGRKMFGKHLLSNTPIWKKWSAMIQRCYGSYNQNYYLYGGRGITVCNEWKNDFMNFYNWAIKNGYKDNLSIDRIDVNGNYEPENCRFVDNMQQSYNKRNTMYVYNGDKKYTVKDLWETYKIDKELLRKRIRKNYPFEDIIYKGNLRYKSSKYTRKQNKEKIKNE